MTSYKSGKDDLSQNYDLDFLDNNNDWNLLSKVNNVTNNVTNITGTNIVNQEYQDYYDWQNEQYIDLKYNGGLEQITLKLVPNIIIDREEDGFHQ